MSRPRNFDPGILLIVLCIAVLGGTAWLLYTNLRTDEITGKIESNETIRAVIAIEDEGRQLLTNVVFYEPSSNRLAMFDIPRNLGAILNHLDRVDRLSVLFEQGDFEAYRREISRLLGVSVPYYLFMDIDQLSNLVDLLGGVEVFISDSFSGGEPQQDLASSISPENPPGESAREGVPLLPSGTVVLDGAKTASYIRYSAPEEGTIERVRRQQEFLQSLISELGNESEYLAHSDTNRYLMRYIDTTLDTRALLALVEAFSELESGTVITRRVQGTLREVNVEGETSELLFPHFEGQWLRQTVRQVERSLSGPTGGAIPHRSIELQILNGTLTNGLAGRTQALYEGYGFNVVGIGNAPQQPRQRTVVISHTQNTAAAEQVAEIIRAQEVTQREEPPANPTDYQGSVDVTLILGEDFDGTYVR